MNDEQSQKAWVCMLINCRVILLLFYFFAILDINLVKFKILYVAQYQKKLSYMFVLTIITRPWQEPTADHNHKYMYNQLVTYRL